MEPSDHKLVVIPKHIMEEIKAMRGQGKTVRDFEMELVSAEGGENTGRLIGTSGRDYGGSRLLPNILPSADSYKPPEDYRRRQQERKEYIKAEILRYQLHLTPREKQRLAIAYRIREEKAKLLQGSSRSNPIVLDTNTVEPRSSITHPNSREIADLSMDNDSILIRQETDEDIRMEDIPVERGDGVSTRPEEDIYPDGEVNIYSPEVDTEDFNSEDLHSDEYDISPKQNKDPYSGQEHGEPLEENVEAEDTYLPPPSPMSTLSDITTPSGSPVSAHSPSPSVRFISPPAPVLISAQELKAAKRRDAAAKRVASRAQNTARISVLRAIEHRTDAEENELVNMMTRREAARLGWRKRRDEEREARQGNEAAQHQQSETQMEIRRLRRTIANLKKVKKVATEIAAEMYFELEDEKNERIQQLEEERKLERETAEEIYMEMQAEKNERIRELEAEVEYWEDVAREAKEDKEE